MNVPGRPAASDDFHARFSRRIQWLTIAFGSFSAAAVAFFISPKTGLGIAIGTVLAWLSYRWLDRGLGVLVSAAAAHEGVSQPRVPIGVYVRFGGRYVLIGVLVYATVSILHVPLVAVVTGLFALGAGATAEGLYELFSKSP